MENFNQVKPDNTPNSKEIKSGIFYNFSEKKFTDENGNGVPIKKLVELGILDNTAFKFETIQAEKEKNLSKETLNEYSILLLDLNNLLIQLETNKIDKLDARDLLNDLKESILKYKKEKDLREVVKNITNILKDEK